MVVIQRDEMKLKRVVGVLKPSHFEPSPLKRVVYNGPEPTIKVYRM